MMKSLIVGLDAAEATLAECGGKGLNLIRLVASGFGVPAGFVLTTGAYRRFVEANRLNPVIRDACARLDARDPASLEASSSAIRDAFAAGTVPEDIAEALHQACRERFGEGSALAVRSSATSEDLPELSFAGQQDTFLNVIGLRAVLAAVVGCWSSLWTARAIGYRDRAGIRPEDVELAVVVQQMVPAEVSGVLFTANPLTGARHETVIDATFGLGEALVSGQVEPDQVIVDARTGEIRRTTGAKAVLTVPLNGGGVETRMRDGDARPCLTDAHIRELDRIGRAVAERFGEPQDIEWAIAGGAVQLVQARPITSLYPVPGTDPDSVWFSFGAIQGMLQPITPLGRDALGLLLSGASELTGARKDLVAAGYVGSAGERLWIRYDRVLRHPWGARHASRVLPMIEPSIAAIMAGLAREKGWDAPAGRPSAASVRQIARVAARILPRAPLSLARPERRRRLLTDLTERIVAQAASGFADAATIGDPWERLGARVRVTRRALETTLPRLLGSFAPVLLPAVALLARLGVEASRADGQARALVLELLRGLPGNVTTEMDLALWEVATQIRADERALAAFRDQDAATLAAQALAGTLPGVAQSAVAGFLARYGMRGVAEIDLGQPRWRDQPLDLMGTLRSYAGVADPSQTPDAVFARGVEAASRAGECLVALLAPGTGPLARAKAARLRFMISRVRALFGARETPKFTIVRVLSQARDALLASGADLVGLGVIEQAEDVFYLHLDELERLSPDTAEGWPETVAARREATRREQRRGQVPRVLTGDGRAFYEGLGHGGDAISGSPVSPGVAEGRVRVVFDPQAAGLRPGEILVCPGTDPAWTPLFLAAGGLVTEVGGMMTHGSVVAREYGIPAVVGVHEATSRLRTGQRVRIDGTSGSIEVLDDDD